MTTNVVTVGLLSAYIKQLLEADALLSDLWVEGEVSELFVSRAGHIYFTLRDADSQIKSVLFRGNAQRQRVLPNLGDSLVVHGRISTYERDGAYQLYVDVVEHAGAGLLALKFEQLRQALEAEGLFDDARKRPLPPLPRVIGVVTSEQGAVWHDIQTVLRRRYPLAELVLAAAPVQGEAAPDGLCTALRRLQEDARAEVIIVARGGGSAEDLAAFNDERLARAVFACRVPVISAVGHETDWTIIDYVADVRAATPSAAAELVAPAIDALLGDVRSMMVAARGMMQSQVLALRADSGAMDRRLQLGSPERRLAAWRDEVERLRTRLRSRAEVLIPNRREILVAETRGMRLAVHGCMAEDRADHHEAAAVLTALNPRRTLQRGYAAIERRDEKIVASAAEISPGEQFVAHFADGRVEAIATAVDAPGGVGHND